jgi:GT2 family glycosyltransferase
LNKPHKTQPDISISIVNTNNREIVLQCLASIAQTAGDLDLEVIVVDNACTDASAEAIAMQHPQVRQIEHSQMLGFSTNNNLAFAQACGRYLMLLNDDTIVQPGAFQAMLAFMDSHPEAGVVGALLLSSDGTFQKCYDHNPHPLYDGLQPISEYLRPLPPSNGLPLQVATVHGACMMVRASAAETIGYLDTRFDPLYSEETDWCFRFRKAGWKVYHLPAAQVIHLEARTMNRSPVKRYERIFEKKAVFFRKHYGPGTVALYKVCLFGVNLAKALVWSLLWAVKKEGARAESHIHWNMVRRALFF